MTTETRSAFDLLNDMVHDPEGTVIVDREAPKAKPVVNNYPQHNVVRFHIQHEQPKPSLSAGLAVMVITASLTFLAIQALIT